MGGEGLREPAFLVLTALASGPSHGYALLKEIEAMSGGRVRLRTSTLYAALERLTGSGLVEETASEVVNSRLRRIFVLTEPGRELLTTEAERMVANAFEARRRLQIPQA